MTTRHRILSTALIFGILIQGMLPGAALGQEEALLTPEQQIDIIGSFSERLIEHYVLPEKAELLIDALDQAIARGEYSSGKTIGARSAYCVATAEALSSISCKTAFAISGSGRRTGGNAAGEKAAARRVNPRALKTARLTGSAEK